MMKLVRCRVSAVGPGEERHWIDVEASSLYEAVFAYNAEVVCGSAMNRGLERGQRGMAFEVVTEDGRTYRTTWDAAMRWANRQRE